MIIYISFDATLTNINRIQQKLDEYFEQVAFDAVAFCFICHKPRMKFNKNAFVSVMKEFPDVQSYIFLNEVE